MNTNQPAYKPASKQSQHWVDKYSKNKKHLKDIRSWSELPIVFELDGVRIVEELVTGKLLEQLDRPETAASDMQGTDF